jgi:hypothetical protein
MKLSMFLMLSLFAYSSMQASGKDYPPSHAQQEYIEQQRKGFEHFRKQKTEDLRKRKRVLEREAKQCEVGIIPARLRQLNERYHPGLKKARERALLDLLYCYQIMQEKESIEEKLYEREHE